MYDVTNEWVQIHLEKESGTEEARVKLEASSSTAVIMALTHLVEHIAEGCGTTVEHVLSVLTVVLLAPDKEENKQEEQA